MGFNEIKDAVLIGFFLSFMIGPVFFMLIQTSIIKGARAAIAFDLGVILGDIVFIEIETEGEELEKGESFGSIEAVKTVSDSYMPLSGEVIEVNEAIIDDPSLVNKDFYGEGWLIKIKLSNASEADAMMDSAAYTEIAKD